MITELGKYHISAGLTWGRDIGKPHFENEKQAGFHLCFVQATQHIMFTLHWLWYIAHHVYCPLIMRVLEAWLWIYITKAFKPVAHW